MGRSELLVRLSDVTKSYGGVHALKGITLDVHAGEVHALMGENGAGKSTALGIAAGRVARSSGDLTVFGSRPSRWDPRTAARSGVVSIYQELTIVPDLSPEANVYLGRPLTRNGFLDEREMRRNYGRLRERLGVAPAAARTAGEMSVAEQQMLEIMRALVLKPRVILFDEPTAALAESERAVFHRLVRQLRSDGIAIVLVSHNLEEVLDLSDYITVFRDGVVSASAPVAEWGRSRLVTAMLGSDTAEREHDLAIERRRSFVAPSPGAVPRLRVANMLDGVDFAVHSGEIVGIAGLVGSGRSSVLRSILGADRRSSGQLWLDGKPAVFARSPRHARKQGICMIPEDRKRQGLLLNRSSADNIVMAHPSSLGRFGIFLRNRAVKQAAIEPSRRAAFDRDRLDTPARMLSGGNQQKLLFARWQFAHPRILLVDEPTRGVDVGAKAEILTMLIRTARETGMSVVVVSSEFDELIAVSDRIIVLSHGRKVHEVSQRDSDATQDELLTASFRDAGEME